MNTINTQRKYWAACSLLGHIRDLGIKECRKSERGTFPRFTVIVDGESTPLYTLRHLSDLAQVIYATAPRVFVNAGKGITVDFDCKNKLDYAT